MPGSATLGTNLVDSLVATIDGLRDALHTDFGVRQFRVFVVTRSWSSGEMGVGTPTSSEIEIDPQPLVAPWSVEFEKEPCGIDEAGVVSLSEVSLTYTETELAGPPANEYSEFWYRIEDAHGQGIADTYWQVSGKPFPDRIQTMGWNVKLQRMSTPEGV